MQRVLHRNPSPSHTIKYSDPNARGRGQSMCRLWACISSWVAWVWAVVQNTPKWLDLLHLTSQIYSTKCTTSETQWAEGIGFIIRIGTISGYKCGNMEKSHRKQERCWRTNSRISVSGFQKRVSWEEKVHISRRQRCMEALRQWILDPFEGTRTRSPKHNLPRCPSVQIQLKLNLCGRPSLGS